MRSKPPAGLAWSGPVRKPGGLSPVVPLSTHTAERFVTEMSLSCVERLAKPTPAPLPGRKGPLI